MEPLKQAMSTQSKPRSISISGEAGKSCRLFSPPETASMRSGYVELQPGESVGLHTTGENEEMVITLEGSGELRCPEIEPLPMNRNFVVYNPPNTLHDVVNTGKEPLRYIYIVANALNGESFTG